MKTKNRYNVKKTRAEMWLLCLFVLLNIACKNSQVHEKKPASVNLQVLQEAVPYPIYDFPLDSKDPTLWYTTSSEGIKHAHYGEKGGDFEYATDRFGGNSALAFKSIKSFIVQKSDIEHLDSDMTVSFWTYIHKGHSYPPIDPPPYDPSKVKNRYFTLTADQKSGGLARIDETAVLGAERTVTAVGNTIKPWYLWLYQPTSMEHEGWYQIVAVMAKYYTKVYIYKPDGTKACSYNYMGNDFQKKIVIGYKENYSEEEIVEAASVMDDLKVWDVALNDYQVDQLNAQETNIVSGIYKVRLATTNNQYLHTFGNDTGSDSGTKVEIHPTEDLHLYTYLWNFQKHNDYYKINLHNTDQFLHTYGNGTSSSTKAEILRWDDNHSQTYEWVLDRNSHDNNPQKFRIKLNNTNNYLHTEGHRTTSSTRVEIYNWQPENEASYIWELEKVIHPTIGIDGVYNVGLLNSENYITTPDYSQEQSKITELQPYRTSFNDAYKWEFIRQSDNTYLIRLFGTNQYLHSRGHRTADTKVELYTLMEDKRFSFNWELELLDSSKGVYHIKLAGTNQYLHTYGNNSGSGTQLEIYPYASNQADSYKWKLSTPTMPVPVPIDENSTYRVKLASKPELYFHTRGHRITNSNEMEIYDNKESTEAISRSYNFTFAKQKNGTYLIKLTDTDKYVHTYGDNTESRTLVEILDYNGNFRKSYEWELIPTKNKDEYLIKIAGGGSNYYLRTENGASTPSTLLFIEHYDESSPSASSFHWKLEKQIYPTPIETGRYRIALAKSQDWYLHTFDHKMTPTKLELHQYDSSHADSFDFTVIKNLDGTYFFSLTNTDPELHMHTFDHNIEKTKLETYPYSSSHRWAYPFIIVPVPDVANQYYIKLRAATNQYMHTFGNEVNKNTEMEIYPYDSSHADSYKWTFKPID